MQRSKKVQRSKYLKVKKKKKKKTHKNFRENDFENRGNDVEKTKTKYPEEEKDIT